MLPWAPLSQLPMQPLSRPFLPYPLLAVSSIHLPSPQALQLGCEHTDMACLKGLHLGAPGKTRKERKALSGVSGLTSETLLPALGIAQQLKDKNNQN